MRVEWRLSRRDWGPWACGRTIYSGAARRVQVHMYIPGGKFGLQIPVIFRVYVEDLWKLRVEVEEIRKDWVGIELSGQ